MQRQQCDLGKSEEKVGSRREMESCYSTGIKVSVVQSELSSRDEMYNIMSIVNILYCVLKNFKY